MIRRGDMTCWRESENLHHRSRNENEMRGKKQLKLQEASLKNGFTLQLVRASLFTYAGYGKYIQTSLNVTHFVSLQPFAKIKDFNFISH